MAQRVLLTGISSFTGCHIAHALVEQGYSVVATLTKQFLAYSQSPLSERLEHSGVVEWIEEAPLGSSALLQAVSDEKFDVFINHGASIAGYRKPDFNYIQSLEASTRGLETLIEALVAKGCRRFIHTGSVFEPDEGRSGGEAVSIYGVSKQLTWQVLRFFCHRHQLPLSKIVIPNPIGVYENTDRLSPIFFRKWKMGETAILSTPDLVRDQIPAPWLAKVYRDEAGRSDAASVTRRPSAFAMTNERFVKLFSDEVRRRTNLEAKVEIQSKPSTEPTEKINSESVPEILSPTLQEEFWNHYIEWLNQLEEA